ncbi:MAG: type II toxin-antitoxin system VapC family toxin [Fimbriimonadales bacterium]|nr:type II toxin-antitoxin system VapC family toxin [Fimbriimonadales bacterium]
MRIYLDTAPVIYLVERISPYHSLLNQQLAGSGNILIVSDLTRMECRVKPLRIGNLNLIQDYNEFFARGVDEVVPLSRAVIDIATEIRAKYGFKTPDSIRLAAAQHAFCDVFLTNDIQLTRYTEIQVQLI